MVFQFLMVRLKDTNTKKIQAFIDISIPYGAIKRIENPKMQN